MERLLRRREKYARRRLRRVAGAAGVFSLLWGQPTRADEPLQPALLWRPATGAERCISSDELTTLAGGLVGQPFVPAEDATLLVFGTVERLEQPPRWRATLSARSARGEHWGSRVIEKATEDCRALDDELLLVVSMLVESKAPPPPSDTQPSSAAAPPPLPLLTTAPPARASERANAAPRRSSEVFLSISPFAARGALPGWTHGGKLGLDVDLAPILLDFRLDLLAYWPSTARLSDTADAHFTGADVGLLWQPLALRVASVRLNAGLGASVGVLRASASATARDEVFMPIVSHASAGAGVVWYARGRWLLTGDAQIGYALRAAEFRFETALGERRVFRTQQRLIAAIGLGYSL